MMAAVATRTSNDSPRGNSSRMSSPRDAKKNNTKSEDLRKDTAQDARVSPSRIEAAEPVQPPEQPASEADAKPSTTTTTNGASTNAQPLGPPPRPSQNQNEPDYFNTQHNNNNGGTYQAEPNPFEAQFGNPSTETPGKGLGLPPVSSLTSPQPLLNAGTPGWPSLRAGPLSPAMLTGPTSASDYFDTSFSRGFPTPNESGLRTGLTPGGGGSMFPAPSPNSQALFNSLQSGGATPSTLDFYRTSIASKVAAQNTSFGGPTSQPTDSNLQQNMDRSQQNQPDHYQQQQQQQQHADADAVNGLYMLAQANGGMRSNNTQQFAVPNQTTSVQTNMAPMQSATQSQDTSPVAKRANNKNSIGGMSSMSADTGDFSDSGESEQAKPATRSRGKKPTGKAAAGNGRRKADDTPAKAPASKRSKGNNGSAHNAPNSLDGMDMSDDEGPQVDANGKKMTDEEKRKNFLERNRVAALKCRQRKKQWLANLQAKVELFSTENDALSQTVTQLREELVNLKTLLLAHKECPISQQQGLSGPAMNMYLGADAGTHHANPYGMGMNGLPPGLQMSMAQGQQGQMQRR